MTYEPIYLEDWDSPDWEQRAGIGSLKYNFQIDDSDLEGVEILLAYYSYEDYEGIAFVLFRKDGKLYEVNGSHCSCYGLEDQWQPEEVMLEELENRVTEGTFGLGYSYGDEERPNYYNKELKEIIKNLKNN